MPSIHFTSRDIARTRIMVEPLHSAEALLALDLYHDNSHADSAFALWRRQIQRRSRSGRLSALSRPRGPVADLWRLTCRRPAPEPPAARAANGTPSEVEELRQVIAEFSAIALAPYRRRIAERLRVDRETRARILLSGGVEELLTSLHPSIRWSAPVLTVPCGDERRVDLAGRGLWLAPSLFLRDRPGILIVSCGDDAPILVYPASGDPDSVETLWQSEDRHPRALSALVGQTRAAALRALRASCSTTELGQRLGVSSAAASQHTTVLRDAGLITTRRRYNAVVHSLTPLGAALLDTTGGQDERVLT